MAAHHPELCPPPPEPESPSLVDAQDPDQSGGGNPFGPGGAADGTSPESHLDVVSAGDTLLSCDRDTSENILSFINFQAGPLSSVSNYATHPHVSPIMITQGKADMLSRMDPAKVG